MAIKKNELYSSLWASCDELRGGMDQMHPLKQTAIDNVLSDMNTELDALQKGLSKTQTIKQGMMQELPTGKTRLV